MSQITSVKFTDVAYMSDEEFFQVLMSSADYFPGLYRYTLGTLPFPYDNLNFQGLFAAFMQQQHFGKQWAHQEWFARQDNIHRMTMEDGRSRNQSREDDALANELTQCAYQRYKAPTLYALAALDLEMPVQEIVPGITYMMMGSHVRFEEEVVHVGYDDATGVSVIELKVPFNVAKDYIETIMSIEDISNLFQYSRVVAHLMFEDGPLGTILTSLETMADWHQFNSPVFATPLGYFPPIPIRYAKLIGVSNVASL